ncbi:Na(+)-translocating NADH-quinone reductase subunit F [Mucinivorans hirudinis]|uniref:Na(+)-translocating NADH-quinone reductase subunit F n=1 Tax=Mucinivorans hirudinis TaxID=1433126 RepID=A0A060RCG4_9BACT|nr:Na(+)-translocating NADH-quinone reductase subunit F [Mucinivorans hirudinis]
MNYLPIIVAIIAFLVVVLVLVAVLLYAKKKLMPSGNVTIDINHGERVFESEMGGTLLSTLGNNGIFLPSACGGGGSCGMCKCQIMEGGGEILPTETNFFTRRQQAEKWRLGCQVKVKEDMKIHIEEEVLGVKKWECEVVSNDNVATFIKEFVVKLPEGETLNFRAGGYIQIDVPKYEVDFKDFDIQPEYREDWDKMKIWDLKMKNTEETFRAYSMANHPAEGNIVMLNIRIATPPWDRAACNFMNVPAGVCSSYIFSRKPGDKVTISGPYGEFFMRETPAEKMFIGGGAGMAPMRSHIFDLFLTKRWDKKATFWYGARSLREMFYQEDYDRIAAEFPNFNYTVALSDALPEDNWKGKTGFIHQVIYDEYLKNHEAPEDIEYYLCGPPMMIDAVVKMLDSLGVPPENIMFDNFGS